jgi:hypothetical protein
MEWVLTNQPVLVEAAGRITNQVLNNHIRTAHYGKQAEFSNKMVSDIIMQLQVSSARRITSSTIKPSVPTASLKKPRGRPRKQLLPKPSMEDNQGTGPRTRNKSAGHLGALGLLTAPAFTTSPIKSPDKKV